MTKEQKDKILKELAEDMDGKIFQTRTDFKQHEKTDDDENILAKSIAIAFQFGMALGFAKKYDEMDKVIEEVKEAIGVVPDEPERVYRNKKAEMQNIIQQDGTLVVNTEYYSSVKRVLVENGTNGTLFYAEEEPKTNNWIPVSERLPEENKTVIASTKYGVYPEAKYTKEYGWEWAYEAGADYWKELEDVDAWMALPEPYKVESEEQTKDELKSIDQFYFEVLGALKRYDHRQGKIKANER